MSKAKYDRLEVDRTFTNSAATTISGAQTLSGATFSGTATDSVVRTVSGVQTFSGNNVHTGNETYSGNMTLSGAGTARPIGWRRLSTRYELFWVAGQRGKPGINADINSATESVREIADPDFEILGSNGSSDDCTFYAEGGITLQTDGGGTDSVILLPHLDANQSAWSQVTWGTDKSTEWECDISTAADITACVIWAGLKLTNTATTATDAKQAFFRYAPATNSGKWQAVYSINGTDTEGDSGVTVAVSTRYHLKILISSARIATFYINGVLVGTSTALDDASDFIPYIGVLESEGVAKTLYVHGQAISRVIG